MATANQLIQDALDLLERPDLETLCRNQMRRVVLEAHARQEFSRDRVYFDTAISPNQDPKQDLTYPVGFRKLDYIELLDSSGETICANFLERTVADLRSYANFREPNNYYRKKSGMEVRWKVPTWPSIIRTHYYEFPTWVVTEPTPEEFDVQSDSWILEEFDGLILYKTLAFLGAAVGRPDDTRLWAALAEESTNQLLANYGDA